MQDIHTDLGWNAMMAHYYAMTYIRKVVEWNRWYEEWQRSVGLERIS